MLPFLVFARRAQAWQDRTAEAIARKRNGKTRRFFRRSFLTVRNDSHVKACSSINLRGTDNEIFFCTRRLPHHAYHRIKIL
jgi:hypothetical protein